MKIRRNIRRSIKVKVDLELEILEDFMYNHQAKKLGMCLKRKYTKFIIIIKT